MTPRLWTYLRRDKRRVHGWLQRVDAEIIGSLLALQAQRGWRGACAEIGVHHGKSFIPLCMSLREGELALGIDLFGEQAGNLDASGHGDLQRLRQNLQAFGVDEAKLRLWQRGSDTVSPAELREAVGAVRYFSVDGGHWKSIVQSDLRLAEAVLSAEGVIALDDYARADWPDVTAGYALWQAATGSDIVPFAIGSNKLYLCRRPLVAAYRAALATPLLQAFRGKTYLSEGQPIDSYRLEPHRQDEEGWRAALVHALKLFRPGWYLVLRRWRGR